MRIGNPQAGQSFWIGHSTVSRSGRSRCEILAICGSSCSEDGRSHHDFQTARFAGLVFFTAMVSVGCLPEPAEAKELLVGPTRALKVPSQAAAAAKPGDVVKIDSG